MGLTSRHDVRRRLRQYWREPGNPRLKGLFLAALPNTNVDHKTVGEMWPVAPKERERHLKTVYGQYEGQGHRILTAPVKQNYNPAHLTEELDARPESGVARTLARDKYSKDDDRKAFLAGEKTMDLDEYIQRALLQDSPTHLDTLFRKELGTTFVMGAQPRKIFRDAANVRRVNRQQGDLPRESSQPYAPILGHSDEIPTGAQGFDTVKFDCSRVALGFEISDPLMNQSEPDVFASLVEGVGGAVENTINRIAIVEAIDQADSDNDADADIGGSNELTAVQALNAAVTNVDLNDFGEPNSVVVHPNFEQAIFDDTNVVYANRSGETQPVQDREMGSIMGLGRWKASESSYELADDPDVNAGITLDTDNTFGYDGTDEVGAVAFVQRLFNLVIWDDFDMDEKEYEDPIRDLQGLNVRTWVDAVYGQTGSGARIFHDTS